MKQTFGMILGLLVLVGCGTPSRVAEEPVGPVAPPAVATPEMPLPVSFTLTKPGVVTLVIDDANGNRVRNLISETPFEAGTHVIGWDGRDDRTVVQVGQHAVFRVDGQPVVPGTYTVRGLVRDPVELRYELPVNTAGNPPWPTVEGHGAWMGDTLPPMAVLSLPGEKPMMLLGTGITESYGIVWTDLTGQRINGIRSAGGGGGWWGAFLLARDNGPDANPNERIFLGGMRNNQAQVLVLKIAPPFPDPTRGVRSMTVPHSMDHGRLVAQVDADQNYPDLFADPSRSLLGGIAVHNRVLVMALTVWNKLQVRQAADGAVTAELALESPRGLAVTADGNLLALSGTKLVRYDSFPPRGEPTVLVGEGLKDPRQIALDDAGNIYVSDRALHQVKVFTAAGQPLRTIGEPGGRELGPYNPRRMMQPEGLAVSPDGKLWVAENYLYPRRLSIWNLDGTFVKELIGNGWYGGGANLDPRDKNRAYVHGGGPGGGMEFALDWKAGTSTLKSIYYLHDKTTTPLPRGPQFPVHVGGRQYFSNYTVANPEGGEQVLSIWQLRQGGAVPVAAVGVANNWDFLKADEFKPRWPEGVDLRGDYWRNASIFVWSDLNDDGRVQPDEVQMQRGFSGGITLTEELAVTTSEALHLRPVRFTAQGAPVYDLATATNLIAGARASFTSGGGQVLPTPDGWTLLTWPPAPMPKGGHLVGARDGVIRWLYPTDSVGVHAGYASPVHSRPGQILGMTHICGPLLRPRGTKETLLPLLGTQGTIYLLTSDGMFVATLFKDYRAAKPGPSSGERGVLLNDTSLGQDCFHATINQTSDGSIYVVAGHDATFLVRVDGLESIRRLPEQKITVTAAALEAVESLGAITPRTHPHMPVVKLPDGRSQFHYRADIRADKGAKDSIRAGTFAEHPAHMSHCNGIYGQPTVYKFEMPGNVVAIEASAAYGNHAGPANAHWIRYSFDGKNYKTLVEETRGGGEFTITGQTETPDGARRVWLSFAGIGNSLITLKAVEVKLTYQ